jgi:hypothetical protein
VQRADRGSAVVELVLLGVPLLVPLVYLAVAVSAAQQARAAVTDAARQAGRAYVTGAAATAPDRARAVATAVLDHRTTAVGIRYAAAGSDCGSATETPWPLHPGAVLAVCVTARVELPMVPGVRTLTGRFVVHADRYRDYS